VNARAVTDYLNAQIAAGAEVVMIFDTWGGILAHGEYEPFSLVYTREVLANVSGAPRILFTKGGAPWLAAMMKSGCDAVGLDSACDAREARRLAAGRIALQGNLDPAVLLHEEKTVRETARRVLDAFGPAPGHVFNLGHGVLPSTPPDSVSALIDEVRTYSTRLRAPSRPGRA
jgi:uroporphyrinogen decarboxylase